MISIRVVEKKVGEDQRDGEEDLHNEEKAKIYMFGSRKIFYRHNSKDGRSSFFFLSLLYRFRCH